MRRLALATAVALALAMLAVACGRYGAPQRAERSSPPVEMVPLTDPAVSP